MALVMIAGVALDPSDVGSVAPCMDPAHENESCVAVALKETRQVWHLGNTTVEEIVEKLNASGA